MIDWDKRLAELPQSVREIAEVIGYDRALCMIGNLPRTTDDKHGERDADSAAARRRFPMQSALAGHVVDPPGTGEADP